MKRSILTSLFCTALMMTISAQKEETLFGRGYGLSGIWGSATHNYSFFDDDFAYARGGSIGLEFGNDIFVGYTWQKFRDDAQPEDISQDFRLRYNGFLLGITPNAHRAIHPRISMLLGGGRATLGNGDSDRVFVFQPALGLELNVFQWFRLGLEGGYRLVGNESLFGVESTDLSSPFAQIDLRFGFSWGR